MAKLGAKIETIKEYKSGIEVNIYLDKKKMEFGAEFADFIVTGKDGEKVKADILAAIRERSELVWTPVIRAEQMYQVSTYNGHQEIYREQRENMGLTIERFYVARKMDGSWVRVEWFTEPQHRMMHAKSWHGDIAKGATGIQYSGSVEGDWTNPSRKKGKFILPYSDALWDGLTEVLVKMKMIRELVSGLLGSEEGMAKLIAIGSGNGMFLGTGE